MSDLIPWFVPWSGRLLVGAIVFACLVAMGWALRRRRLTSPHCSQCGYSLVGAVSSRCPECGHACTSALKYRGSRRWRLAGVFLLIALGVPALVAARRMRQYGWDYYLTFGPGHFFFGTSTLDRVTIDGQSVRVIGDRSPDVIEQTLEVRSSASTNLIQSIDWMLGDKLSDGRTFGRGEDITGNGRADIVVREFTGGAHCCTTYRIYEISAEGILTEIARIDAENGGGFEDRDGDSFPEFILPDWTWAYELTCYACLRYPRVVLKFDGTTYTPSVDLMLETEPQAPDVATWMQQAADDQVKIGNDPTSSAMRDQVWGEMLHLIYAGQAATAWALHDAAWNDAWGNKIENLAKFKSIMHKSQFWSVINELNGGTLD